MTFHTRNRAGTVSALALALTLVSVSSLGSGGSESPWTRWYRNGLFFGGLQLIHMRSWLEKHALYDPYLSRPAVRACTDEDREARSVDGSCTDLDHPSMGVAHSRFGRNIPLDRAFPLTGEALLTPDPRQVSRELLTRGEFKEIPFLNLTAATWIQFMVHDWVSHGDNEPTEPFLLPLAADDPFGQTAMRILRTAVDGSRTPAEKDLPPTYLNEVSPWWDGSQVYGSDRETQRRLRDDHDGLMRISAEQRLPLEADGIEAVGFKRNWWLGLSAMHHLFVLEHNAIARRLKSAYPNMSDEELFAKARLVNTAVMAKIHTVEWTPSILPNRILSEGMNANWYGMRNLLRKSVQSLLPFKVSPVLDGIVGGKRNLHGVPYSLTEEFVSVYRLHSLLPESLTISSSQSGKALETLPLAETRDAQAPNILKRHSLTDVLYSLGTQHPGALTLNNYPRFLQSLELPVVGKMDLGTIDILRDRERGVPRYNDFRRLLHLKPVASFEDLTDDAEAVAKLKRLYQGDVEKLDLLIGTLAESTRPTGFGFGETQFQIFLLMASRRLQADRFFTTDFNSRVYSQEGMDWVNAASFRGVLLRHLPGLRKALDTPGTAFNPWNRS